eukprot:gnl/TRDRNA2_/TRDRNA2_178648_c0_seq1.p1 gnl/TRDRNA2_/TRDRNA2_178648_c0~~gnl/TRDRNA2_/TRDRNA2_178648_c0_seq1.p1  ORF type:complete len:354 (-),score=64.66 gnl/TRDRNA2_/TRDRNA2_178648_c0_seq1:55-1116(-)
MRPYAEPGYTVTPPMAQEYSPDVPTKAIIVPFSPRGVFMYGGGFVVACLVVIPIWNCVALLRDKTFMYFIGPAYPVMIIIVSVGLFLIYTTTISIFFRVARPEAQTDQTIVMLLSVFATAIGVSFMLIGTPLYSKSHHSYDVLFTNCQFGAKTGDLYQEYMVLHNLRSAETCKDRASIEECPEYQSTRQSEILKAMEDDFKCSGYCYKGPINATKPKATGTSLLEIGQADALSTSSSRLDVLVPYPPTLFSKANFQASCEGMAARDMRNFVGAIATQVFYEGLALICASIVVGFMKLFGLCMNKHKPLMNGTQYTFIGQKYPKKNESDYGSVYSSPSTVEGRSGRYVQDGVLY